MFIINNSISAQSPQKDASKDSLSSSVSIWHPKMLYLIYPDQSLKFILPYEPDQSGFYNLFFISKESGETLLLDSIQNNQRYFTQLSLGSCYDVILLYNNGKYIKQNDIILEERMAVDISNQHIQPSDSLSGHWINTLRAFDYAINDRELDKEDNTVSEYVTKGYIFPSA